MARQRGNALSEAKADLECRVDLLHSGKRQAATGPDDSTFVDGSNLVAHDDGTFSKPTVSG